MKLPAFKSVRFVQKVGYKVAAKCAKHSPDILLAVGVCAITGGVVFACKATLKLNDILDEGADIKDKILKAREIAAASYSEDDAKHDLIVNNILTGKKIVRVYAPSAALLIFGVGCITGGHIILRKRNLALTAAYKALDNAYKAYRERVKDAVGEETENDIYHGLVKKKIDTVSVDPKSGKEKKVLKDAMMYQSKDPSMISPYARFFDETVYEWKPDPLMNKCFLDAQQRYANNLLEARGHIFLNEVYDMLGFQRTREGAVVGWIKNGDGDGYVDFGIYDGNERSRAFVNGHETSILLDFNVDGTIWDKI